MLHHKNPVIFGKLVFSLKKTLLIVGDVSYYVRLPRSQRDYIHGDTVRARIIRKGDGGLLSEVEILSLEKRSTDILLARIISRQNKRYLSIVKEFGFYETSFFQMPSGTQDSDVFSVRFSPAGKLMILDVFARGDAFDYEEKLLFFVSGTRTGFAPAIQAVAEELQAGKSETLLHSTKKRRDFRGKCIFTIDGSDAKDLDDAISVEKDEKGNTILGVYIADVAEYVREDSALDREALSRATSVYTPGKVIPMLPEAISNDLCSLHPGEGKLVLACLMTIDALGNVLRTELVEGIIDSVHRGVYEDIQTRYEGLTKTIEPHTELDATLMRAYELYTVLKKRRQKEGKILFESAEAYFIFDTKNPSGPLIPTGVRQRSRVDAHMLIEEFMVIANEEVAKWCEHEQIPFLSRVHGLPPMSSIDTIRRIIAKNTPSSGKQKQIPKRSFSKKEQETITPREIRVFLESLGVDDLYLYSRLLLPKMAKAVYRDRPDRHFGLALTYYAHFTSPIRRYPDLQIHRIIKEKLRGTLTDARKVHYAKILKKVARQCSEREKGAEDIERAFDSLYACRYMSNKVGDTYTGRVSGISEFAYFVELATGIEVTVYLPRNRRYMVDSVSGILASSYGKPITQIGKTLDIKITEVLMGERRIIGERI